VNLLGGRATRVHSHPYVASELGADFSIDRALQFGMVPVVVESMQPSETLRAYTSLYIHEEVFAEALVRSADQFARFLGALSFSHGEVLTVTNIARDSGVGRGTVESYITIIEDLMLGFRLPIFSHHAKRHLAQHPKFYFFDSGVYRALRPTGPLDDTHAILGHALEGLVAQHLRACCDQAADGRKLYYWRTRSKL
jgi:predicted AAA+ superfamily ATPase